MATYTSTIYGMQHKGLGWEAWEDGNEVETHETYDAAVSVLGRAKEEYPECGCFGVADEDGHVEIYEWRRDRKPVRTY